MSKTESALALTQTQLAARVFPRPHTALARIIGDPISRAAFHQRLQLSNRFVVAFYRIGLLPLLGAGKTTMLLVTLGRKSRRIRRFPIGYWRIGGDVYVISGWGKDSNWYKNLQANPDDVSLQIGFRRFPVQAQVLKDRGEMRSTIERLIGESPASAQRLFGWDPESDQLSSADFSTLLEKVLFVRFLNR